MATGSQIRVSHWIPRTYQTVHVLFQILIEVGEDEEKLVVAAVFTRGCIRKKKKKNISCSYSHRLVKQTHALTCR